MNKKFILLGAAGFVAPRHMKAIKDVGGEIIAIMDPSDSVGIIDSYFPNAAYFKEFERLDRWCAKREGEIDYCAICTPNYLHDPNCRWAMRSGMDVICEKPLVLRERNLDGLKKIEEKTGKKVWNILQLRLSAAYKEIDNYCKNSIAMIDGELLYTAPRGVWYDYAWKTDIEKSGGLEANIGIHLLDLLCQLFGFPTDVIRVYKDKRLSRFSLKFGNIGSVYIELSLNGREKRTLNLNNKIFDLSRNMKNLHTKSYEKVLAGEGFDIESARFGIKLCDILRET